MDPFCRGIALHNRVDALPGATLPGARLRAFLVTALALGCLALSPAVHSAGGLVDVIEYYNSGLEHYFITADPAEISTLDGGAFGGAWKRTGSAFSSWEVNGAPAGTMPVCRFFGTDRYRADGSRIGPNSHFYTADPAECAYVRTAWSSVAGDGLSYPAWSFESHAFAVRLPVARTCPTGTQALYRTYNDGARGNPNHRYSTRPDVLQAMPGWTFEGIVMCVPPNAAISESEYNDNPDFANQTTLNREVRGSLANASDQDWFYIDVTTINLCIDVLFDVPATGQPAIWSVWWYGPMFGSDNSMNALSGRNIASATTYQIPAFKPGRYYYSVKAFAPDFYNSGQYVVSVTGGCK